MMKTKLLIRLLALTFVAVSAMSFAGAKESARKRTQLEKNLIGKWYPDDEEVGLLEFKRNGVIMSGDVKGSYKVKYTEIAPVWQDIFESDELYYLEYTDGEETYYFLLIPDSVSGTTLNILTVDPSIFSSEEVSQEDAEEFDRFYQNEAVIFIKK